MEERVDFLDQINRRKYPRLKSKLFFGVPVNLNPMPPLFGDAVQGHLLDLSAGGIAMLAREAIPHGTKFNMNLTFIDRTVLKCPVKVCRVARLKEQYFIGLEFIDLPEFLFNKLVRMSTDIFDCDARIQNEAKPICNFGCGFFNLCDRIYKTRLLENIETPPRTS